ncbi:MAG: hypothetical protein L0332_01840 [Chloroflexi bacterium]|nr:hypothetical protein [Chloroflexota bacterium]MCI0580526.1 hypothetical protein [Chloroflexota bacterium]MCI0648123.1 hypothetical protein [Chloroflexota bacterium]MCI0725455.1 hypothetical protein [Chloroflexota bacterium]
MALVRRLSEQGILLHAEAALTSSPHPLRSALKNMLVGGQYWTYVWKDDHGDAAAFVQLRSEVGCPSAQITFLAAEQTALAGDRSVDEAVWLPLLEQLVVEAGRKGIHSLVAEVSESGPELPVLRRAGFAVYTRQDIWVFDQPAAKTEPSIFRPRYSADDWDIQLLYANNVPRLIQLVEPNPPLDYGQSWVLREEGELAALVHIHPGPVAGWMRVLIHPNADTPTQRIIQGALQLAEPSLERPLYCCVRRYQSWLQHSLEQVGFRHWGSQAVLVKHVVQHVSTSVAVSASVLETQAVVGSSPLVQGFSGPAGNGHLKQMARSHHDRRLPNEMKKPTLKAES